MSGSAARADQLNVKTGETLAVNEQQMHVERTWHGERRGPVMRTWRACIALFCLTSSRECRKTRQASVSLVATGVRG